MDRLPPHMGTNCPSEKLGAGLGAGEAHSQIPTHSSYRISSKRVVRHAWARVGAGILALLILSLHTSIAFAAGLITLDGTFADWSGQANLPDPIGDCDKGSVDIVDFAFATNPGESNAYFMAERMDGVNQPIGIRLYVDTNNNGVYNEPVDRIVRVRYQPTQSGSSVDVDNYTGDDTVIGSLASNVNWGESLPSGAQRIEWVVSFADLGIVTGQPIRMYLESRPGNTPGGSACDSTSEVQWSPADALGLPLLVVVFAFGVIGIVYRRSVTR
jgi:hypothetical protein